MNSFIICRAKSLAHVPVVVLLFGAAFSSNAQVTGIKGIVEDPDHQPLGGITLRIERQDMRGSYSVRSSSNGSFLYMGLPVGDFRLFCEGEADSAVRVRTEVGDPAVVRLTCALGEIRRRVRDNQSREPGREPLDRVRADLNRAAREMNYLSEGEMRRFERVRDRLAEFQRKWERGRFDREDLDEAISGLNGLVETSRLRARDRDELAEDLRRLREIRERHDRSSASEPRDSEIARNEFEIGNPPMLNPALYRATAPETFKAKFTTTKGVFVVEVHRSWAPLGADRFYNLVKGGYFDGGPFYRVRTGFMAQFGFSPDPAVSKAWDKATIKDDPVLQSNKRGFLTFAKTSAPNSRSTHLFINFVDNSFLDNQGFAPFGTVVEGMEVLDSLFSGYGETDQVKLREGGIAYVQKSLPNLDLITSAEILL